jgi:DNA-binding CsgD family transcriptional regulator
LLAGAPRSPIRLLAAEVARRARLRIVEPSEGAAEPRAVELGGTRSLALTKREADVLGLLAESRTNREIGEALFISPKTASVHVSAVMRKLGVKRRADAARFARRAAIDHQVAPVAGP